ncbi:hypothetical protein J6590_068622 [Homalodisca vitripennis]|nr:hypothetical protein J6590_068622 [Homalodisca vitripennis]
MSVSIARKRNAASRTDRDNVQMCLPQQMVLWLQMKSLCPERKCEDETDRQTTIAEGDAGSRCSELMTGPGEAEQLLMDHIYPRCCSAVRLSTRHGR